MAFLREFTDGALRQRLVISSRECGVHVFPDVHGLFQALLEHRELDGDVRQGSIYISIRLGTSGRIVFGIFIILGYGPQSKDGLSRQRR